MRRGFQVFARNCANCHGAIYKKYDILLDKAYKQLELAVKNFFLIIKIVYFVEFFMIIRDSIVYGVDVLNKPRSPPLQAILLSGMD